MEVPMWNSTSLKVLLSKTARSQAWGAMVMDWAPEKTVFWDGGKRTVPRRMAAAIDLWRRTGAKEADAVYAAYRGGDVLDIGSFNGLYAAILAPKAKDGAKFLCFEPDPKALAQLQHNLGVVSSLFPRVGFTALPWVAGDGSDVSADFAVTGGAGHPRYSSTGDVASENKSVRVDDCVKLFNLRPSLVKIDVEGAELGVLRGLTWTLANHRPDLMLELHPNWQPEGSTVEDVISLLQGLGYSSRDLSVDETSVRQLWSAPRAGA